MTWTQVYNPFDSVLLSALAAAIPVAVLLGLLAFHVRAHLAAVIGLLSALAVATVAFGMPVKLAGLAALNGALFGLLPIGWIVLNIIFLHRLTEENGSFKVLQDSIANITDDRRLQLLMIAFCFGAFFEGAAGFDGRRGDAPIGTTVRNDAGRISPLTLVVGTEIRPCALDVQGTL